MQLAGAQFKWCLIVLAHPGFDDGDGVVVRTNVQAQQVHICGALTGVQETRGQLVRESERESAFWKTSQHQVEAKLKRKSKPFSCPLEDNSTVCTVYERARRTVTLHYISWV